MTQEAAAPRPATGPAKDPAAIRDAATVILTRRDGPAPRVLMGMRGQGAAFMPSKFVFPGGALDPEDRAMAALIEARGATGARLPVDCAARLAARAPEDIGLPLALAAIRECWEETGLRMGGDDSAEAAALAEGAPEGWRGFFETGAAPRPGALRFIFRAITPPYRPRRFDARFFLGEAEEILGDPDDFAAASGELSHLTWVTIAEARRLALPLITEVVLAEVEEILRDPAPGRAAPFFHHDADRSWFDML